MRLLGLVLVLCVGPAASQRWLKPWSYNCSNNPNEWASKYSTCADKLDLGFQSSPINIQLEGEGANTADSPAPLEFESGLHSGSFRVTSNLLTEIWVSAAERDPQWIQFVTGDASNSGKRPKEAYNMERIVLHQPSEHTLNGKRFPVEIQMHFLQANPPPRSDPKRVIVGVFGVVGDSDVSTPPIQHLGKYLNERLTSDGLLLDNFNPSAFLPLMGSYFTYFGSDTAPPCQKDVKWVIMEHTVNVTKNFVDALKRQNEVFHPMSPAGNARPIMPHPSVQVSRHVTGTLLMMEVFPFTAYQSLQLVSTGSIHDAKAAVIDSRKLYQGDYKVVPLHECAPRNRSQYGLPADIPIYSHPDILRLRPDTTVVEQSKTSNVPPKVEVARVPTFSPSTSRNIPPPRIKIANWTLEQAASGTDKFWESYCNDWKARGSNHSDPSAEYCRYLFTAPPHGAKVLANAPMKYPIPPPWIAPIPNNLPISPRDLGNPKLPTEVNPYNPLVNSRIPFDPNEPTSGNSPYLHLPNGDETRILKPALAVGLN